MMPTRFEVAGGEIEAMGVIFEIDPSKNRALEVKRISF
jgi:calcineurin-like phosphoesterase